MTPACDAKRQVSGDLIGIAFAIPDHRCDLPQGHDGPHLCEHCDHEWSDPT